VLSTDLRARAHVLLADQQYTTVSGYSMPDTRAHIRSLAQSRAEILYIGILYPPYPNTVRRRNVSDRSRHRLRPELRNRTCARQFAERVCTGPNQMSIKAKLFAGRAREQGSESTEPQICVVLVVYRGAEQAR
jgi:hypothetical protein